MRRRGILGGRLLLAVLVASALGACGATIPTSAANLLLPAEQEEQLGREVDAQLRTQVRFLEDPAVQSYVERVGRRVAEASEREREIDVSFQVIDDPENVNAFATVGGRIYVFSGLLLAVRDEAELASVLAHEVAHVTHRDVARLMIGQVGLEALAAAALGQNPGMVQQIAAQLAGAGVLAAHTREQERDADEAGLMALARAGYEPAAMIRMYETLARLAQSQPNVVQQFFATHPPTEDRIQAISAMIDRMPPIRGRLGRDEHARVAERLERYYGARRTDDALAERRPRR
jgi:predicted Zn-dependent protease